MRLNKIKPSPGANRQSMRVGRGIGSGLGKTAGRGHKGQHARSGGSHKAGFEGGQMPIHRRLPKVGFRSRKKDQSVQVFLYQLDQVKGNEISLDSLREAGLISNKVKKVKIVLRGELNKSIAVKGVNVTTGAKAAIEAAGGTTE